MTDFDHQLDHELRRLPAPRAPETLLPRVMRAVAETRPMPWYSRGWAAWPAGLKVASAACFAVFMFALWSVVPTGLHWISGVVSPGANQALDRLTPIVHLAAQIATLGRVIRDVTLGPIAMHFSVLAIFASVVCALFWSAVTRLAPGEAASQ